MLPKKMEQALRFYTGDIDWALKEGRDASFWGDCKGYGTLNALFFPGIANERARAAENKPLNPAFLADPERLLELCEDLIESARLCASACEIHTFRVEREENFLQTLCAGHTVAFTSTSLSGFLGDYQDKKGLVLLEYTIPPGIPCVDVGQALVKYLKAAEQEVLLPPYLPLTFSQRPLLPPEEVLRDYDGQPPLGAYRIHVGPWSPTREFCAPNLDPEDALAGQRVLCALCARNEPNPYDVVAYTRWKEIFCCQLRSRCRL